MSRLVRAKEDECERTESEKEALKVIRTESGKEALKVVPKMVSEQPRRRMKMWSLHL